MQNQFPNCPIGKNINEHFQAQLAQLNLEPETEEDKQQLMKILNYYLCYPDKELAKQHRYANRLGILDLTSEERIKMVDSEQLTDEFKRNIRETKALKIRTNTCKCCGFIVQEIDINVCKIKIQNVKNLGPATTTFFKTFIYLIVLLIAMTLIYSAYAFGTNISVAKTSNYMNSQNSTLDYLSISLGAKSRHNNIRNQDGEKYYTTSVWLGFAMLLVWSLMFIFFKVQISQIKNNYSKKLSVSDFSIVIQNMPAGFTLQEIQKEFNIHLEKMKKKDSTKSLQKIKVVKYNEAKPFYFNQEQYKDFDLSKVLEKYDSAKDQVASLVQEYIKNKKFITKPSKRRSCYSYLQKCNKQKQQKYKEIDKQIKSRINNSLKYETSVAFVTFLTYEMRQLVLQNCKKKSIFQFFRKSDEFSVKKGNKTFQDLKISVPLQPEDINWGNLGISSCKRFCLKSNSIAGAILAIVASFSFIFFLSLTQKDNKSARFISFVISLAISLSNLVLIKVIQLQSIKEKHQSMTKYQRSLVKNSVFFQLLNLIHIPILTNFYIKEENIYLAIGLVEDIFILAITNSLVPPIMKMIDPYNIFTRIRYKCNQDESKKLRMNQFEFNEISQKMEFQIGMEYIYIISNFLFICFFVSLQPIISLFAIIGFIAMYWAQKYVLFKRCQRPPKGADFISSTMYQVIFCGPIFFSLGNLTWCYFLPDESFRGSIKENIYCLVLSALMAFLSSDDLYDFCFPRPELNQSKTYYQKRIYFHAEYDRLNPSTNKVGVEQYLKFLSQKKREMELQANSQQNEQIFRELTNNTHRNLCKGKKFLQSQENYTLEQIFNNQNKNATNPFLLLNGNLKNSEQITSLNQINLRPIENFIPTKKFNYQEVQEALPSSKVLLNTYNLDILDNQPQKFSNAFRTSFDIDDIDEFQRDDKAIEQIEPRLDANNQPL